VRLARAIRGDEHILILGDFDADGATSSALAVRALRAMGRSAWAIWCRTGFGSATASRRRSSRSPVIARRTSSSPWTTAWRA